MATEVAIDVELLKSEMSQARASPRTVAEVGNVSSDPVVRPSVAPRWSKGGPALLLGNSSRRTATASACFAASREI